MTKRNKIIYWVSTIWLASAMLASGLQQLFHAKSFVDIMAPLGYPMYFLTILGVWKVLGVIAILAPKYPVLKEWAYAGFFFVMSGALFSYVATGASFVETVPALILLVMIVASWYFRPADKKMFP